MDGVNTSVREVGDVVIVDILKDMDFLTAKEIKDTFMRLMNQGKKSIIGNLQSVRLVDSSGLEALASAQIKARSVGVNFSIVLTSKGIRKLLATTGLDDFLKMYESEADALKDLQA